MLANCVCERRIHRSKINFKRSMKLMESCDLFEQIYDGPTTDSRLLGAHCRNELPPSYVTTSNEMLVVMRTDRILSAKGFKASYHKACGARIVVRDQGYIVPATSYTTDLNDNWNCEWILVAEDPGKISSNYITRVRVIRNV